MHGQFLILTSQNPEYVKTHCKDLINPFHLACRKWNLYNNPQCWFSVITPIQTQVII